MSDKPKTAEQINVPQCGVGWGWVKENGPGGWLDQAIERMIQEYSIAAENLTAKQVANALKQAISCGDFMREVRLDGPAQAVTYMPYRQHELQKKLIRDLRRALAEHGIKDPTVEEDYET